MSGRLIHTIISSFALCLLVPAATLADVGGEGHDKLRHRLEGVFHEVLEINLSGPEGTEHGAHFRPDSVVASERLISSLARFITANVAAYPLSSTTSGLSFDLSSGIPVATRTSPGPIFAERATTLGKGRLNVGANASFSNLSKLRGIATDDIAIAFLHEDVKAPGLGDSPNEFDHINLAMNMDLDATVVAVHATYGITDRLDFGVAIPITSVGLTARPVARMNSFTFADTDTANHSFGGSPTSPELLLNVTPIDSRATGLGDIALRAKYNFHQGPSLDMGALAEVRLPTGDDTNFLGTGYASYKVNFIASGDWGTVSPHVNIGYDRRTSKWDRDEFELTLGYDQRITENLTMAVEWMGEYELGGAIAGLEFPDPVAIGPTVNGVQTVTATVPLTNIPNAVRDNIANASFGIQYTPSPNLIVMANVILPMNDGGLRSSFMPTIGVQFSL